MLGRRVQCVWPPFAWYDWRKPEVMDRAMRHEIPAVGIADLAPPRELSRALAAWHGFAGLWPASVSLMERPYLVLRDPPERDWIWERTPPGHLPPLGCYFIRDIVLRGGGYLFHEGRFVREYVNLSDVALRRLADPEVPDNPRVREAARQKVITEPALLILGPGWDVYGHWLLDFAPRIALARAVLGAAFDAFVIPLPEDSPDWVIPMLGYLCGIVPGQIRLFDRFTDLVICQRACVPSYCHTGNPGDYVPHPFMRRFYAGVGDPVPSSSGRRICISRQTQERVTAGVWRIFDTRPMMEAMAVERGYEIVRPETLSLPDQVALFRSASCVLGEHGSGMHGAVFAPPGTVIATVGAWNAHQFNISSVFGHRGVCMARVRKREAASNEPFHFSASRAHLCAMFAMIDAVLEGGMPGFDEAVWDRVHFRPSRVQNRRETLHLGG